MKLVALTVLLALLGCQKHTPPPPPPRPEGTKLHIEHAPGVPVVDIREVPDGGPTSIRIGGATAVLPGTNGGPPMPPSE